MTDTLLFVESQQYFWALKKMISDYIRDHLLAVHILKRLFLSGMVQRSCIYCLFSFIHPIHQFFFSQHYKIQEWYFHDKFFQTHPEAL